MFLLYAFAIGLLVGLAVGGRPGRLANLHFRWTWVAVGGFAVQLALFSAPLGDRVGDAGPPLYVASTAIVLLAVLRNLDIPGMVVVAAGAIANLAAVTANGGFMPTTAAALAAAGRGDASGYSNSTIVASPALQPLTDIFALPSWVPLANVFSVGDALIGLGIAAIIVLGMRERPGAVAKPVSASDAPGPSSLHATSPETDAPPKGDRMEHVGPV